MWTIFYSAEAKVVEITFDISGGGGPEWTAFRDEYRTAIEACSVGVIHNTYY